MLVSQRRRFQLLRISHGAAPLPATLIVVWRQMLLEFLFYIVRAETFSGRFPNHTHREPTLFAQVLFCQIGRLDCRYRPTPEGLG
jgi:hypothetical protein